MAVDSDYEASDALTNGVRGFIRTQRPAVWDDQEPSSPDHIAGEVVRVKQAGKGASFRNLPLVTSISHAASRIPEWNTPQSERHLLPYRRLHVRILFELKSMGWWVGLDRTAIYGRRNMRLLRKTSAGGACGRMRLSISSGAGQTSISFWRDHIPGRPRYDTSFELLDLRSRLRIQKTQSLLASMLTASGYADATPPVFESALDRVEYSCQECWHHQGYASIWQPRAVERFNFKDADGAIMQNGDVRYFYGDHGSGGGIRRGLVFHHLNSQWWVVAGAEIRNITASDLYSWREGMPRRIGGRRATTRVGMMLADAVNAEDFERAIVLKRARDSIR